MTNLNMLFMCWARLRCIVQPVSYSTGILMSRSVTVIFAMWLDSLIVWSIVVATYDVNDFTLQIKYLPSYIGDALNVTFWLVSLVLIFTISVVIIKVLYKNHMNKKCLMELSVQHMSSSRNDTVTSIEYNSKLNKHKAMSPHVRFLLIIVIYWLQWIIPCTTIIIHAFCGCISINTVLKVYWLTYTVCLTDPIVIFLLNPKIKRKFQAHDQGE